MNKILFIPILFVAAVLSASGQQPIRLTFREAVRTGLERNIILQQQKNQATAAVAVRQSALLQMAPSVSASGSTGAFSGNSFNQQQGEVINGRISFVNGSIGAGIPVFNGLSQVNR
ncbi:MAG: TolC family protein, partial [Bacteroidota bacterium]